MAQITLNSTGVASDGALVLQSNGTTTAVTISTAQVATLAKDAVVQGLTVGRGAGAISTNTAVGASALAAVTTGGSLVAVGSDAGKALTTGADSVAVGANALQFATTGTSNVGLGQAALYQTTTGAFNSALGTGALQNNTTASNNTAVGYQALYSGTTGGAQGVAVGFQAGYTNNALYFTAVGYQAGYSNSSGATVVAVGYQALYSNTTGTDNLAVGGYRTLYSNTTGSSNVALGRQALQANTTASDNTAVGYQAGYDNITGTRCTFIGRGAGENSTVSDNTFVGENSGSLITTGDANTILGRFSGNEGGLDIRTASNHIVLSDGDGNPRMWIAGTSGYFVPNIRSSATANNDLRFNTGNGEMYYQTSSQRYKTNIVDLEFDTSNLYNLRPVSYDDKATGERCFGLIAEETFVQIPDVVVQRDIDGESLPDSIPYSMLSVVIINEMKKLKTLVDTQATLITILTTRITALEAK